MKPWLHYGFEIEPKGSTPGWFKQVHGDRALDLDQSELDAQGVRPDLPEADAGFTRVSHKAIYVFTADCLSVLLHGENARAPIAAIHAGWRGALQSIVAKTLQAWDYPKEHTHALLGPAIGACCFEVKEDFVQAFEAAGRNIGPYLETRAGKTYCDLVSFVAKEELAGVASVDTTPHRCTVCSEPRLPSYRRNGKADPRLRGWIRKD